MTKREAAIIETFTGITMLFGEDRQVVCEYAEELMGHPIWSREFGQKGLKRKLKEKSKPDFIKICKNLTD